MVSAASHSQETLYGAANGMANGFGESSLYTINPGTGAATLVGPIGFDNVTGLAFLADGRLVGSTRGPDLADTRGGGGGFGSALLVEINPATGAGSLIGEIDNEVFGCGRMPDITFDADSGTLYGYSDQCSGGPDRGGQEGLYTIDPISGAGTSVGPTGYNSGGNGLAWQSGTDILFATPRDDHSLVTIDQGTGMATEVPGSVDEIPETVNALAFDPVSGVLYGSQKDESGLERGIAGSRLVTIDPATGFLTDVGQTTLGLDAIVFGGSAGGGQNVLEVPTSKPALFAFALFLFTGALWFLRSR